MLNSLLTLYNYLNYNIYINSYINYSYKVDKVYYINKDS